MASTTRDKPADEDVFAELEKELDRAVSPHRGPSTDLVRRWLTDTNMPSSERIEKLKDFSMQLRAYALYNPNDALNELIATIEFEIHKLQHGEKSKRGRKPNDPFDAKKRKSTARKKRK